jgi:Lrp/AsnC family transcriptional regulator, regulator for asnA, asnC and gidA
VTPQSSIALAKPSEAHAASLDDRSKAIIEQLQQDGRRSFSAIARAVGLSEAAVRQRVTKLLDDDVLKVVAVTNPMQLGFPRQAMVHVKTGPDLTGTADRLAEIPEVDYCVVVAGEWDVLVEVVCEDDLHLLDVITAIRTTEGVLQTQTLTYLSLRKQEYDWGTR